MNSIERLEGRVALLDFRTRRLEEFIAAKLAFSADEREALGVCARLDLPAATMHGPRSNHGLTGAQWMEQAHGRRRVAAALRELGWSLSRIARAFAVPDKTARRWVGRP